MTIYKSKLGFATVFPLAVALLILVWVCISSHIWSPAVIVCPVGVFVIYLCRTTYYTISGNTLNVRCGFVVNTDIDIDKINSITDTNSALSAPAWSLDRIEIFYNTFDSIVISPPDKAQFIADLQAINPNITMTLKNKK